MDRNVTAKHDVPLWNETRWNGCWNAEEGVGIYLHAGRFRHELDLWWAQVIAYLPDQQLCVQRVWGRNGSDAGVRLAGLDLQIAEDGWTCSFDGVGELTDTDAMAEGVRGASAPSRSLRFELQARAVTEVWDQDAGREGAERPLHAGDTHIQQGFETTGTLRVGAESYALDGIGFKDHSSGRRDFGPWRSHRFLMIVGPEWTAHLIAMAAPDGTDLPPIGAFIRRDGRHDTITRFELPDLEDARGGPVAGDLVFETGSGEAFAFAYELVHAAPLSITEDNDNMNGVNWEIDGDPVVLIEGKARLTAPDGTVLHCFHERSMRRSLLERQAKPPRPERTSARS
jgi:hypothetical protein